MPVSVTRRTVLQKVRGCTRMVLPQLVNTGFQVLFHSPPGVLFTFPSQYYTLSVTEEYLALRGGPRSFTQSSTCFVLLWILPLPSGFVYGVFTLSDQLSQNCSTSLRVTYAVRTPGCTHPGLGSSRFARRYSGNRLFSFSSSGYLDVSVHRVPSVQL